MADAIGGPRLTGPRAWAAAFAGFSPGTAAQLRRADPLTRLLYASRVIILIVSVEAGATAGLLAADERRFQTVPFIALLVGYVVLHATSNLTNDYFGLRRGHDTPDSPRRRYTLHPLADGAVTARFMLRTIAGLLAIAGAIAVYFVWQRGWPVIGLVAIGAAVLYAYDAAPRSLKQLGLGELATFIVWGPLMVAGGFFAITGTWSGVAVWASLPSGLGVGGILVGKHIDQRRFDRDHGQRTLVVILGDARARRLAQGTIAMMYVSVVVGAAVGWLSPFVLLSLLAAPRAVQAWRRLSRPVPGERPAGYIGWPLWYHRCCLDHSRRFGWLYLAGLAVGALDPALRW